MEARGLAVVYFILTLIYKQIQSFLSTNLVVAPFMSTVFQVYTFKTILQVLLDIIIFNSIVPILWNKLVEFHTLK